MPRRSHWIRWLNRKIVRNFQDVVLRDLRSSYSFILVQNGIVYGVNGLTRGERGSG